MDTGPGRSLPAQPTVETCPHRRTQPGGESRDPAVCDLVGRLLGAVEAVVDRDVCEACCRSFPPTGRDLNPVVASVVFARANRLTETSPDRAAADRFRRIAESALDDLDILDDGSSGATPTVDGKRGRLARLVPPPRTRTGGRVREWAVGVTTSPRIHPTLDACLDSLARAGWDRPHLFIDGPVRLPDRYASLPATYRSERLGAWPNYLLAMAELLMLRPRANAYLIVQDDVIFFEQESIPRYLERVLWPGTGPCLVSLYCCEDDQARRPGWRAIPGIATSGPLAMVYPPEIAKAFVTDFGLFEHRWHPDEKSATAIRDLIPMWASRQGVAVWFPTPSLAQHIGETSTVWPGLRTSGARRAGRFAGGPGT